MGGEAKGKRERILRDFHAGAWEVLVNATLLTEGYDEPKVSCVLLARPTTSLSLFLQIIGRGLRLSEGKTDCLVIDVTSAAGNPSAITLADVFGPEGPGEPSPLYRRRRLTADAVKAGAAPRPGRTVWTPGAGTTGTSSRAKGTAASRPGNGAARSRPVGQSGTNHATGRDGKTPASSEGCDAEGGLGDDASQDGAAPDMLPDLRDYLARAALVSAPLELFRRTQAIHAIEVAGSPTQLKVIAVAASDPPREGMIKIARQRDGWLVALDWADGTRDLLARGIAQEAHAMLHAARLADRVGPPWLIATNAPWRRKPATAVARRHARSLGIRVDEDALAGAVSDAITLKRALDASR